MDGLILSVIVGVGTRFCLALKLPDNNLPPIPLVTRGDCGYLLSASLNLGLRFASQSHLVFHRSDLAEDICEYLSFEIVYGWHCQCDPSATNPQH